MKNILGKHEDLELFNDKGKKVYKYYTDSSGYWSEYTYDNNDNILTCKDSAGFWSERTCDEKGNELTCRNSNGYWCEYTYDDKGNELTCRNSDGVRRGFDIPEYTMEELVQKLGNFKLIK